MRLSLSPNRLQYAGRVWSMARAATRCYAAVVSNPTQVLP